MPSVAPQCNPMMGNPSNRNYTMSKVGNQRNGSKIEGLSILNSSAQRGLMSKVAIVTDSTAYIPQDLVKKNNITVIPLVVIWGEETLEDGIDIHPEQFYNRLKTAKVMPTTSQASIGNMHKAFSTLIDQGYDVLGIFLSSKLSGTMDSATQGRDQLGNGKEKVTLVDAQTTAMAMGFHVLSAARAAEAGASISECQKVALEAQKHSGVYFVVDTLEFLHRGGRIGGAKRFIGTALNLKPILTIADGKVEAAGSVRTKAKAIAHVMDIVAKECSGKSQIRLSSIHANAEPEAIDLLERASALLNPVEKFFTDVSPVVGTHTGPGTVGLVYMTDF
jgi:DegV family protein with EDD domain